LGVRRLVPAQDDEIDGQKPADLLDDGGEELVGSSDVTDQRRNTA
jgi:hypothetical protein